jgi:hypothetical protein
LDFLSSTRGSPARSSFAVSGSNEPVGKAADLRALVDRDLVE